MLDHYGQILQPYIYLRQQNTAKSETEVVPGLPSHCEMTAISKDIIIADVSPVEKRAGGAQDRWCHSINLILARQTHRHTVFQFRIHTRQLGPHNGGRIVFA